jgi:hypothetical protein
MAAGERKVNVFRELTCGLRAEHGCAPASAAGQAAKFGRAVLHEGVHAIREAYAEKVAEGFTATVDM